MRRRSGFTLIELMIVLAIIAALAAIVTPMGVNALNRAKATQYVSDVRNLRSAAQMYYFDENSAPSTWSDFSGYISLDDLTLDTDDYTISGTTNDFTITLNNLPEGVKTQMDRAWTGEGWESSTDKFTFSFND